MPLNFPTSPSVNQQYTFGGRTWIWNGSAWDSYNPGITAYVSTFNGLTGNVSGVTTSVANTFIALQTFNAGISASGMTVGNLFVTGNLTASGGVTFTVSETVLIEDNIITLNANETGAPTLNSGIEIERGTSPNVQLLWNESIDRWTFTNDGTQYYDLPVSVINTLNGLTGGLTLFGDSGITVTAGNKGITFTNTGVLSNIAGSGINVNTSTGNVTITNTGVIGFNGVTGNVTGVTAVNAGTGISITGTTNPTVTNTGVLSFNGLTGAVSGVTTSVDNTFTALQRFSSGISAAGATFSGNLNVSGTSTFTGSANFNAGITTGNIRGSLQTFSTNSSTVTLFSSPTTSIILGNNATDVNLGNTAGTGFTTIKNNLIAGSTLSNTILLPSGQRIKTYSATTTSTSTFTLISESIDTSGFATADITIQASRGTTTTDASEMVKFAVCAYCDGSEDAVVNHVQYANVYSGSSGNSIATYTVSTSVGSPFWYISITPNSTTSTRFRATVILGPSIGSCSLIP